MIYILRRNFIISAMSSVILVMTCVLSIINISNYLSIKDYAQKEVLFLSNKGIAILEKKREEISKKTDNNISKLKDLNWFDGIERPFLYHGWFFTAKISKTGNIDSVSVKSAFSVSEKDAIQMAKKVYSTNKRTGFYNDYYFEKDSYKSETNILFLDCSREFVTIHLFLRGSILIGSISLLAIFILVVFFSKQTVKPIAESYAKQRHFITDAGHELKTPLAIISANTEVIELEDGKTEWTEGIKEQVIRMSTLTENLIRLTRMDEQQKEKQHTPFSLSDTLFEVLKPYKVVASTQEKKFVTTIEKNLTIKGDHSSIYQLIELIIDNAIKYTPLRGTIHILAKKTGKKNIIKVTNTCNKTQKGRHDMIFERFYRTDTSRNSETGGFGIGLSIAKAIVIDHGGKIFAFSPDEKTFEMTIII